MKDARELVQLCREESGTVLPAALLFLLCLGGLLSLLLFIEQADTLALRTQQTADIVSKGARAAGMWEDEDGQGEKRRTLFATQREAHKHGASIVRGAREEAEILYQQNVSHLLPSTESIYVIHQRGERASLYRQGMYHVALHVEKRIELLFDSVVIHLRRTAQSEIPKSPSRK